MLEGSQPLAEVGGVVVVDQRERADDWLVGIDRLGQQSLADEVADCLGSVLVAALGEQAVELLADLLPARLRFGSVATLA